MITPAYSPTATERVLPRLALDFTTASLDSRVTVTRALNTATAVNSSGYVAIVNANLPRFDYDPVTKVCKGLLIEESRANLLLQTNDFGNAAWAKANVTVATDGLVSPDGTQNADTITSSSAAGYTYPANTGLFAAAGGGTYTMSVYAKAGTATSFQILMAGAALYRGTFDLSAKTATTNTANTTVAITDAGNGWYRCAVTASAVANNAYTELQIGRIASTLTLNLWGAQLEAGAFATSYIPTTTTSLTRNADAVSMTGTNFSSWYNNTEGTFTASFDSANVSTQYTSTAFTVFQSASNRYGIHVKPGGGGFSWYTYVGAVEQARINGGTVSANQVVKASATYKANSTNAAFNGTAGTTDTSCTVTNMSALYLGAEATVNFLNGHIQKLAFYTPRLLNAELEAFSK